MKSPRISVILSSFNHSRFISEAINSVLNQTFRDFELYIIDDCSDDNSWEIIQAFDDPRIIAIRNAARSRGAYGFNETIRHKAKGEFIAIHHSDDSWLPTKLEEQIEFLNERPKVGAVFTQVRVIDETGKTFDDAANWYSSAFRQPNRTRVEWLRHFFLVGNRLCHPSVLARKQAMLDAGLYDRRLGQITDFDLWVRMCLRYEIYILDQVLTLFRIRSGAANQSGNKPETHIRNRNEWPLVMGRLLHIRDEAEFFAVFPEMRSKACPTNNCLPFLLALRAVETDVDVMMAFGLDLLYALLETESAAADIREKYGFGYTDLIALSAQIDRFNGGEFFRLNNEIARMKSTISWKITKPLRLIANLPRLVKRALDS